MSMLVAAKARPTVLDMEIRAELKLMRGMPLVSSVAISSDQFHATFILNSDAEDDIIEYSRTTVIQRNTESNIRRLQQKC